MSFSLQNQMKMVSVRLQVRLIVAKALAAVVVLISFLVLELVLYAQIQKEGSRSTLSGLVYTNTVQAIILGFLFNIMVELLFVGCFRTICC